MDVDSPARVALLVFFLILSAFASAAETAFASLGGVRMRDLLQQGASKSRIIGTLLDRPQHLLSTILILNSLGVVGATVLATVLALQALPDGWGEPVALVATVVLVLILTESIPKAIATYQPELVARLLLRPVEVGSTVLSPLVRLVRLLTNLVLRLLGVERNGEEPAISEEHFRRNVEEMEEQGVIDESEKEMIESIIELEDTAAREIMVPRIDIVAVDAEASLAEVVDLVVKWGYSRVPVYEESIDRVVGVVYVKDLLPYLSKAKPFTGLREVMRPAYFIPESKRIDELLRELRQQKLQIAIVVDEYGGTAGLVTIEDLLEEIVGEIQDEYDREEATVERISEHEAIVDARLSVDDLCDLFGLELESPEVDTVGGFVYNQLGKIPNVGDQVRLDGLSLAVVATDGNRIKKVQVVRLPAPTDSE